MSATEHRNHHRFSKLGIVSWVWALVWVTMIWGCTPLPNSEQSTAAFIAEQTKGAIDPLAEKPKTDSNTAAQLPVRYQNPSYMLKSGSGAGANTDISIPVGARIAPAGPKPLRLVIQELAKLKSMNISWASDVAQEQLVHVTIMPEEDFFEAIDNVLRQLDYFHEMQGNTIVIKYKATKKFNIAIPYMASKYSTNVGGDVLGNTEGSNMSGTLNLDSASNKFDIWANIDENLNKILEIWKVPVPEVEITKKAQGTSSTDADIGPTDVNINNKRLSESSVSGSGLESEAQTALRHDIIKSNLLAAQGGKGFYTIDRSIGLITVTAPPSVLEKVEDYINNLRSEIYRQVSIEAKIVEVTFSNDNTTGLDWSALEDTLALNFNFQNLSLSQGSTLNTDHDATMLTLNPSNFDVLIDAMRQQGHVEVLSNPKISVMNGQPAMLSIGDNVKYISKITATIAENSPPVYTPETESLLSGLGLGVIASIGEDNNIVLNLTPVTTKLESMDTATFGGNQISLPKVNIRELSTTVQIKDGEMLVVGGLIDNKTQYNNNYIPGLGELPGPGGKLFRKDGTATEKKELIILMRPRIITL